jgi:F0F1-type ATP synthase membrane subunit b/b'
MSDKNRFGVALIIVAVLTLTLPACSWWNQVEEAKKETNKLIDKSINKAGELLKAGEQVTTETVKNASEAIKNVQGGVDKIKKQADNIEKIYSEIKGPSGQ